MDIQARGCFAKVAYERPGKWKGKKYAEKEIGTDGPKEENADRSRKISMKVEKYRM